MAGATVVYDGHASAYASVPFPEDKFVFEVIPGANQPPPSAEAASAERPGRKPAVPRKPFTVEIKRAQVIKMENLKQFLDGKINWTPYEAIHALEIVLRHVPSSLYVTVARSFYLDSMIKRISGASEVWEGFFQSLRPTFGKLLLNCDTAATAFYAPVNLIVFVAESLNYRDMPHRLKDRERSQVEQDLRNVAIRVTHRAALKKKQKVVCLTRESANEIFFESPDGKISVVKYFEKKYNLRLKHPEMPCVLVAPAEKKIFLPMEVCEIAAGQRHMRKLSEQQTSEMIKITCKKPADRLSQIKNAYNILKFSNNPVLDAFNVKVGTELVQVQGRVLDSPALYYGRPGHGGGDTSMNVQMGAWNLKDKAFQTPIAIQSWAIVSFSSRCRPNEIDRFESELASAAHSVGMSFPRGHPPVLSGTDQRDIEPIFKDAVKQASSVFGGAAPQFIAVILPSTSAQFYGDLKRYCDTKLGVITQCVQSSNVARISRPFCCNLLMKINSKLGGVNVSLGKQLPFAESNECTIVFGADVTHPGIGDLGKPSIAALVASMDDKISKYTSLISVQESRMELIADLKNMVKAQLRNFYGAQRKKPTKILFYRDGVSEGQFAQVLKTEVTAIKNACTEIEAGYAPTVTFVVVQKRHHVRFFPSDSRDADRSGNVMPGTVVDSGVCHPTQFDFFLCSHSGIQGTSRPTHYHVLYDENRYTADTLQQITYIMCYTFARCTRSVSFVPAAYYAHLAAFRARIHLKSGEEGRGIEYAPPLPNISKSMYYI